MWCFSISIYIITISTRNHKNNKNLAQKKKLKKAPYECSHYQMLNDSNIYIKPTMLFELPLESPTS